MEKNLMTPNRLAGIIGLPVKKVKKHLDPKIFSKLDLKTIEKYAVVFKTSLEDLINFNNID